MTTFPGQPVADTALPAVDHAGGIARLMGDAALFARVLGRFRNEYRLAASGIRDALDAGDLVLAQRRLHTLKGAAGMIEAVPLRRQAQDLEHVLRASGDPYPGLALLHIELDRVLAELDALASALPERRSLGAGFGAGVGTGLRAELGNELPAPARAAQEHAFERLMALLDEGNGDAVDLVREDEAALTARLGAEAYLKVAEAIESFDFDGALDMLRQHQAAR
nr:Hpt domain-containing protein [uncultured Massilia sp.]